MENNESLQEAAAREAQEEALANVEIGSMVSVVHVLPAHQVHITFRARLLDTDFGVGPESLETMLLDEADIPWTHIAFRSVDFALRKYLEDRRAGSEGLHYIDLRAWADASLHSEARLAE